MFFVYFNVNSDLCYFLDYVQDLSGGPRCPLILSPLPLKTSVITTNMIIVDSFCPLQLTVSDSSCHHVPSFFHFHTVLPENASLSSEKYTFFR